MIKNIFLFIWILFFDGNIGFSYEESYEHAVPSSSQNLTGREQSRRSPNLRSSMSEVLMDEDELKKNSSPRLTVTIPSDTSLPSRLETSPYKVSRKIYTPRTPQPVKHRHSRSASGFLTPPLSPNNSPISQTKKNKPCTLPSSISIHSSAHIAPLFEELDEKEEINIPPKIRILSIDGGGIRGIMPAYFLKKLEEESGEPASNLFDLVAGTSIGGVITGALTQPSVVDPHQPRHSAQHIFDIMRSKASAIFKKNRWSCGGIFGPLYDSKPLEELVTEFVGKDSHFHESTIDRMIPTFDLGTNRPRKFKSWDQQESFRTVDVLMATAAAPLYFPPRLVKPAHDNSLSYNLADGGIFANNPTAAVMAYARKIYPNAAFEIVSLGTGVGMKPLSHNAMKKAGLFGWGPNIIDILFYAQSAEPHDLMQTLFNKESYSRWNPVLETRYMDLDNTSFDNINALIVAMDTLISDRREEFKILAQKLKQKSDLHPLYQQAPSPRCS